MRFTYKNHNNKDEAYQAVKSNVSTESLKKFGVNAELSNNDSSHEIQAKGKGFSFSIVFEDSECTMDLQLSMLLKPLRKKVEEVIGKEIEKLL